MFNNKILDTVKLLILLQSSPQNAFSKRKRKKSQLQIIKHSKTNLTRKRLARNNELKQKLFIFFQFKTQALTNLSVCWEKQTIRTTEQQKRSWRKVKVDGWKVARAWPAPRCLSRFSLLSFLFSVATTPAAHL